MKTGKEIKINSFNEYNVIFGSVDNKNPKSIYINISAWAEPKNNNSINYNRVIKNIDKKIRQSLFNLFDKQIDLFLKDRTIVDLDIRESGIRYGKRSFMSCEITLFSNLNIPVNSELMISNVDTIIKTVVKKIFDSEENFNFYQKKN